MRNKKGQFLKGYRSSPKTEFKKGQHWRPRKPFWDKEWLEKQYTKKSSCELAKKFCITPAAILFWLRKHKIRIRNTAEARKIKHWGLSGKQNGMYGRTGKKSPRWNGGHSPERQTLYARSKWKELAKKILKRDNYKCKKCGAVHTTKVRLVVHHKKQWSKYPRFRFKPNNLITVCEKCHKEIHKNKTAGWLIP